MTLKLASGRLSVAQEYFDDLTKFLYHYLRRSYLTHNTKQPLSPNFSFEFRRIRQIFHVVNMHYVNQCITINYPTPIFLFAAESRVESQF